MGAGKGVMIWRMPVLGEDDVFEPRCGFEDGPDDGVSCLDGKSPARTEIILDVDNEENIL
jgi:hypothetical protein